MDYFMINTGFFHILEMQALFMLNARVPAYVRPMKDKQKEKRQVRRKFAGN